MKNKIHNYSLLVKFAFEKFNGISKNEVKKTLAESKSWLCQIISDILFSRRAYLASFRLFNSGGVSFLRSGWKYFLKCNGFVS